MIKKRISFLKVLGSLGLPFLVLLLIPGILLISCGHANSAIGSGFPTTAIAIFMIIPLFTIGLFLLISTNWYFIQQGKGTLAPWDPPKFFIPEGPYRFLRNPMIVGVLLVLLSEVIFFRSFALFFWWIFFLITNLVYMPLVEEKELAKRFGDEYLKYKANVPAWFPRIKPWVGKESMDNGNEEKNKNGR